MSRRTPETLADYVVVAICPTLIGLMVGSLMFFLVEVFYTGEHHYRLLFVMAMFVMGMVGIARISMYEGHAYASLFALPLACAVGFAVMRFVAGGVICWPLMALVWWATHKLTWDCTLIDDRQDATGQGLLQQIGLDAEAATDNAAAPGTSSPAAQTASPASEPKVEQPWWETLLEPDRRPHAHGMWVVYFSLAALPLFGVGGWFVTAAAPNSRQRVFWLLVGYVACGLGLLLATSFLGLRRYLRQRRLEMPLEMTATWLTVGAALIGATLILAAVLPRPRAEHSLSQLPFAVTSAIRKASRFAVGSEGTRDPSQDANAATTAAKDGQQTERQGESGGKQDGKQSSQDSKSEGKDGQGGQSGDGKSGESKSQQGQASDGKSGSSGGKSQGKGKGSDQGKSSSSSEGQEKSSAEGKSKGGDSQDEKSQEKSESSFGEKQPSKPGEPRSQPQSAADSTIQKTIAQLTSHVGQTIGTLLKWVFYAALLIAAVVVAWVYRAEVMAAWQKLLAELKELWARWFGQESAVELAATLTPAAPPPRPFASFDNPFASGAASQMPWPELVRYTFAAVEAWARERHCPRHHDQTPLEFAQTVGSHEPAIAARLQSLAGWYSQLAYSPRAAASGATEPLRQLWSDLQG